MSPAIDPDYMDPMAEATLVRAHPYAHLALRLAVLALVSFLGWAALAEVDEVTRGPGRVIPSARVQVLQNLEGGLLAELMVQEGSVVDPGQVLARIDDTPVSGAVRDSKTRKGALDAMILRLEAECEGRVPAFPAGLSAQYSEQVTAETRLFESRRAALEEGLASLAKSREAAEKESLALGAAVTRLAAEAEGKAPVFDEVLVRGQPLVVAAETALYRSRTKTHEESVASLRRSLELAGKELDLNRPLVAEGVVAPIDVLRLERMVNDLEGKLSELRNQFRTQASEELAARKNDMLRRQRELAEVEARIAERRNAFLTEARAELARARTERARIDESMVGAEDRVSRTLVRSPTRGTVKKIHVTTIGGVIRPGMDFIEVVPLDAPLLVEGKIRPADIAFLRPGLPASVRIQAYDSAHFGALQGTVEHISADTIADPSGEPYYLIRVRTDRSALGAQGEYPIIPGMTAIVDVKTGSRTVLAYLLGPLLRARDEALRER